MIKKIKYNNFKCFQDNEIELSPLTILSGLNSMGKSSVIQSLLLLRQSYLKYSDVKFPLLLNGCHINIGNGYDLLYEKSSDDYIIIALEDDSGNYSWKWYCSADDRILTIKESINSGGSIDNNRLFQRNKGIYTGFSYICAERIGPRNIYKMSDEKMSVNPDIGNNGEYAVHYLDEIGSKEIPIKTMAHPDSDNLSVLNQVNLWMQKISPNVKILTKRNLGSNTVELRYVYELGKINSRERNPINVGFGLSYTLPIILALLTAEKNSILLIENPEAHLHPRGQTELGKLTAKAAECGIQIIVETHSDHFINGVRISVLEKKLKSENVSIHFFEEGIEHPIIERKINIDDNGKIEYWPADFLDEWEKNLYHLIK